MSIWDEFGPRWLCFGFAGAIALAASASAALAQPPEWLRDVREIAISNDECISRALAAHARLRMRVDHRDNTLVIGVQDTHTATIGCFPMGETKAGEPKTSVMVLVASNGGDGGRVRSWLEQAMGAPREAPPVGGFGPDDPEPPPPHPDIPPACRGTAWDYSPGAAHRRKSGQRFQHTCPANGCNTGRLNGTDKYSDDSSVCLAAVHAGLITFRGGGTVTYEIIPDTYYFEPSVRNGLLSRRSNFHNGAFRFVR